MTIFDDPVYANFIKDSYPIWLDEYWEITDNDFYEI